MSRRVSKAPTEGRTPRRGKDVGSRQLRRRMQSAQARAQRRQIVDARMSVPQFPNPWLAVRRVPVAAWIWRAACLNAASWSFITPPFQVPDEPDHFAYVKQLAETGAKPTSGKEGVYAEEEIFALEFLRYAQIRQDPSRKAIFSLAEQRQFDERSKAESLTSEKGSPNAGSAASEPPLYYALESIPYALGTSGTLLDRLQLMRLLSALMAGVTALFVFLFLRETLPRTRWAYPADTGHSTLAPARFYVGSTQSGCDAVRGIGGTFLLHRSGIPAGTRDELSNWHGRGDRSWLLHQAQLRRDGNGSASCARRHCQA